MSGHQGLIRWGARAYRIRKREHVEKRPLCGIAWEGGDGRGLHVNQRQRHGGGCEGGSEGSGSGDDGGIGGGIGSAIGDGIGGEEGGGGRAPEFL